MTVMNYKTLIKILIDTKRTKGQKDKVLLYRIIELINKGSNSIRGGNHHFVHLTYSPKHAKIIE